jgi:dTDP-4-dehydrorhamnose 3,5-epimerase
LFIPKGFAHGFCVLSDFALFSYKCDNYYSPTSEKGILWSDTDLAIDWPIREPILSNKDANYPQLKNIHPEELPS